MMDVLVNEVPKPWAFKEVAVMGSRLISRPSASLAVEKQHPIDASEKKPLANCLDHSINPSPPFICHHSRSSSLKRLRTPSSPGSSESRSSMDQPPHINAISRNTPSPQTLSQATMSSGTGFVDHTGFANSNAGSIYGEPECIERNSELPYTSEPCIDSQINPMTLTDMHWDSKDMSFVTETEEIPSPSSSFDTTDMPKDDVPILWEPASSIYPSSISGSASSITSAQGGRYQSLEISPQEYNSYAPFPSNVWTTHGDLSTWTQPYIADMMLDTCEGSAYQDLQNGFNPWSEDYEAKLPKTLMEPIPSVIPSVNHLQQQMALHTSMVPISPPPEPQQMIVPINASHVQEAYQQIHPPFNMYSEYQGDNACTALPVETSIPTTQCIQSQPQFATSIPLEARIHVADLQNAFLVENKKKGLSYKDIKRLGNFKEAESTLRGRFRTLTKRKEQRVRKPKWTDHDITLLCEAVNTLSDKSADSYGRNLSFAPPQQSPEQRVYELTPYKLEHGMNVAPSQPPKVSWKKVGQYIAGNGGSYQFGSATCKKKWCEIHGIKA